MRKRHRPVPFPRWTYLNGQLPSYAPKAQGRCLNRATESKNRKAIKPRLANRCFRPLSHLSVFNSPDINELWSLSLHYTAIFALRGTIVTILSLVPNRSTARRFVSSLECA